MQELWRWTSRPSEARTPEIKIHLSKLETDLTLLANRSHCGGCCCKWILNVTDVSQINANRGIDDSQFLFWQLPDSRYGCGSTRRSLMGSNKTNRPSPPSCARGWKRSEGEEPHYCLLPWQRQQTDYEWLQRVCVCVLSPCILQIRWTSNNWKCNAQNNHPVYVESHQCLMGQGKAGLNKNNTYIHGQSASHQQSLSKSRTPGKSSNKGKNNWQEFSKNPDSVISTTQF